MQDPNNPFAVAPTQPPANNGAAAPNPFQTAEPDQSVADPSPFAGVGTESPFGLVEPTAGRPAKLPERRFPTAPNGNESESPQMMNGGVGVAPNGEASPFERAAAPQASPFEPVVGGPTEGFLADRVENGAGPSVPPAQAAPAFEPAPVAPQNGFQPVAPPQQAPAPEPTFPTDGANGTDTPQIAPNGGGFAPVTPPAAPAPTPAPASPLAAAAAATGFAAVDAPEVLYRNGDQSPVAAAPAPIQAPAPVASQPEFVVPHPAMAPEAPALREVAPPAPPAPVNEAPQAVATSGVAHAGTPQLVLRAIFGVTHELNADEMLQRARTLPGVRNLNIVGAEEARAMQLLRNKVSQLGFGEQHSIALSSGDGDVDIIEEEGTTLAVLHEDGGYAPGVRETLIIVTRELARLNG